MKDNDLDYEQVSVGLNWSVSEVKTFVHGFQNPSKKEAEHIEKWLNESGLDVIKVRKWHGYYQCSDPELSKILEDYYKNLKK